jgi:hypothetical protein
VGESDQTVVKATARIDWRKLMLPSLLIMVAPTVCAILLDKWLGLFPFITIVTILICFPAATIWVTRIAMQEMDRVIAEVTPPESQDALAGESGTPSEVNFLPESTSGAETSPTS